MSQRGRKQNQSGFPIQELQWFVPLALSLGAYQALMYIPLLLAATGIGLGSSIWGSSSATALFFGATAVSFFSAYNTRDRVSYQRGNPTGFGPAHAALLSCGIALVATNAPTYTHGGTAVEIVYHLGSVLTGWMVARASLHSTRLLVTMKPQPAAALQCAMLAVTVVLVAMFACFKGLGATSLYIALPLPAWALLAWGSSRLSPTALANCKTDRPEVLGSSTPLDRWRATIVFSCAMAFGTVIMTAVGSIQVNLFASAGITLAIGIVCFAVLALLLSRTKTLSLTFVFRLTLPVMGAAPIILACFAQAPASQACALALTCTALTLLDQGVLALSVVLTRSGPAGSAKDILPMRLGQAAALAVAHSAGAAACTAFGPLPVLLVGVTVLMVAFVICIPTYEARMVSPAQVSPAGLRDLDASARERYAVAVARFELTAREAEVLVLLVAGEETSSIARELGISRPTVNTHIQHIYAKLDVHSRQELTARIGIQPE